MRAPATQNQAWDIRDATRLGVLLAGMNVATEYDWCRLAPPGVTFHVQRIPIASQVGVEIEYEHEAEFRKGFDIFRDEARLERVVRETAELIEPHRIVYPLTSTTAWDGVDGATRLERLISEWSGGLPVTLGARAIESALRAMDITRIAIYAPYPALVVEHLGSFFAEAGFEVVACKSVAHGRPQDVSRVPIDRIYEAIHAIDGPDVQAFVQCSAGLSSLAVIEDVEATYGKPLVAINPAALWAAARASGIEARLHGFGRLWRDF